MGLMTLNLFSTCCCGCASITNVAVSDVRQRTFEQGNELAIIGISKLRYMFCKSRKFAHEVIPEVNHEARPLLIGPSCGSDRCWRFQCHITR